MESRGLSPRKQPFVHSVAVALGAAFALGAMAVGSACGGSSDSSNASGTTASDGDGGASVVVRGMPGETGCAAYPGAQFCDDFENETDASFAASFPRWPADPNDPDVVPLTVATSTTAYSGTHVARAAPTLASGVSSVTAKTGTITPKLTAPKTFSVGLSLRAVAIASADGGVPAIGPEPDLLIGVYRENGLGPFITLTITSRDRDHFVLTLYGGGGDAGSPNGSHEASVPFTLGTWQRLTVVASTGSSAGGAGQAEVDVDGQMVVSAPFSVASDMSSASDANSYAVLDFGSTVDSDLGTDIVDFDDVVIAYQ